MRVFEFDSPGHHPRFFSEPPASQPNGRASSADPRPGGHDSQPVRQLFHPAIPMAWPARNAYQFGAARRADHWRQNGRCRRRHESPSLCGAPRNVKADRTGPEPTAQHSGKAGIPMRDSPLHGVMTNDSSHRPLAPAYRAVRGPDLRKPGRFPVLLPGETAPGYYEYTRVARKLAKFHSPCTTMTRNPVVPSCKATIRRPAAT